jgi:C1A family cysteine protease
MIRKYTYIKTEPKHVFSTIEKILPTTPLPSTCSLYKYLPYVKNQGKLGSCTACSLATAVETLEKKYKLNNLKILSPLFLYYNERKELKSTSTDSGSSLSVGIHCLQTIGICPQIDCPYNISKFNICPSQQAYKDALIYKINKVIKVIYDIDTIKSILNNHPIVIGIMVYSSFENDSVTKTGIVPYPDVNNETYLGGHAMCMYGYDDTTQTFLVRNSWGPKWGNNGDCSIPYKYILDEILTMEMWTCISFKNLNQK